MILRKITEAGEETPDKIEGIQRSLTDRFISKKAALNIQGGLFMEVLIDKGILAMA